MIGVESESKYDKNVNQPGQSGVDYPNDKPFRTKKVNLVWQKAQKVSDIRGYAPFQCLHFLQFTFYLPHALVIVVTYCCVAVHHPVPHIFLKRKLKDNNRGERVQGQCGAGEDPG